MPAPQLTFSICPAMHFLCLTIGIIFVIIFALRRVLSHYFGTVKIHRNLSAVRGVLCPPNASNRDILISRALANMRLIRAFNLTNSFVSPEASVHTSFVGRATSLLKSSAEQGWSHFQSITLDAVDKSLPNIGQKRFDTFIQDVTMRVALLAVLGIHATADELDSEDIHAVSTLITLLWSLSKKPGPIPAELLPRLNHHLRRLVPDETLYQNPLDFIIPTWETLWRVVATTVAYAHLYPAWSEKPFSDLHKSPSNHQFRVFNEEHPSAEWFVTEVMRLHPPSNRITRASAINPFPFFIPPNISKNFFASGSLLRRECADIGAVLRDEHIWGPDATIFSPFRFRSDRLTPEQNGIKLLPFGQGRYRCIAATWAPVAAGIMSAAILDRLQDKSHCLIPGKDIGGRDGWEGWTISTVTAN